MHNSRGSRFLTVVGAPTGCTKAGGRRPLVSARKLHRPPLSQTPQLTHLQPQCVKSPPRSSLQSSGCGWLVLLSR